MSARLTERKSCHSPGTHGTSEPSSPRKYTSPAFVGGRFGFEHESYDYGHVEGDDTRFGVSALVGGEYFITRRLSFEGEIGFGIYFGSLHLGTGSRLAALFYL